MVSFIVSKIKILTINDYIDNNIFIVVIRTIFQNKTLSKYKYYYIFIT
jgi:hypothetical protein